MKLSVSAVAWNANEEEDALKLLASRSVRHVEHVPARADAAEGKVRALGLELVAFQALLFGTSGLQLFGAEAEREALAAHLTSVCDQAERLGARALIFGSPKNRRFDPESVAREQADALAREFFRKLGTFAELRNCWICLEPNPIEYGTNFLVTTVETAKFVRSVGSRGVRLNLDAGALVMNGEDASAVVAEHFADIGHVHVSEPNLAPVGSLPETKSQHRALSNALLSNGYAGIVSIEMLRPAARWEEALAKAIDFVRDCYGAS